MPAAARSAWLNSQLPISIAIDTMAMNQCRSISSDARIAAPSSTPTPMAAGRLRPARDGFRPADSCAESFTSITRAERSESNGCRGTSDLEQLGFLALDQLVDLLDVLDRKSTRLNSSHVKRSYAVFCLKKKITP